jgi:hypothetical protein
MTRRMASSGRSRGTDDPSQSSNPKDRSRDRCARVSRPRKDSSRFSPFMMRPPSPGHPHVRFARAGQPVPQSAQRITSGPANREPHIARARNGQKSLASPFTSQSS